LNNTLFFGTHSTVWYSGQKEPYAGDVPCVKKGKNGAAMDNIAQLLEQADREHGCALAIKMRSGLSLEKCTYHQLWTQARRTACFLQQRGMKKGDRVLLCAPNSPTWVIVYLGTLVAGGVVVPLDVRSTQDFVEKVAKQTEPVSAIFARSTLGAAQGLTVPRLVIEDLPGLLYSMSAESRIPQSMADDLAAIMYTSGTTGEPKGVMLTHRNLTANVEMAVRIMPLDSEAKLLSVLPLSHMYEQIIGLLVPLRSGACIVYLPSRQPNIILRAFRSEGITAMALVPQALQMLMNNIEREAQKPPRDFLWRLLNRVAPSLPMRVRRLLFWTVHRELGGELQFLASGGASLDPGLAQKWENLGLPVLQGYGTTEATALITGSSLCDRSIGTVGKVARGQELMFAPDGEILIRGENVTCGYWRNAAATRQAFRDGWYCTGDLGFADPDGYVHFKGRKKNLIVLADGMNVYPEDIEDRLVLRPEVKDAIVVGLPQRDGRIEIHAVILSSDHVNLGAAIQETNRLLASHQQIRGFTVWPDEEFPRTHTLKVKRHEVLAALGQEEETAARHPKGTRRPVKADLYPMVAQLTEVPRDEIAPSSTLGLDLGLDSLSIVELLCLIEEEMGIRLDEQRIPAQASMSDLEALIADGEKAEPSAPFAGWPLGFPAQVARSLLQCALMRPAVALLCPTRVTGLENLDNLLPPFLLSANHTSHLDTPLVLKVLPREFTSKLAVAAAADYWFANPVIGGFTALLLNSFPMARRGNVRPSLEHTVDLIDRGWSVLIFPEGTRSLRGELQPFKSGVGLLAVELGVPVVSIHIRGAYQVLPKGARTPRRGPVDVTIGPPVRFPPGMNHSQATQQLEQEIHRLSAW
jgi:long-chain acyl-CoA synthetase